MQLREITIEIVLTPILMKRNNILGMSIKIH